MKKKRRERGKMVIRWRQTGRMERKAVGKGRGQEGANRLVYMLKRTHWLTGRDNVFTPHVEGEQEREIAQERG